MSANPAIFTEASSENKLEKNTLIAQQCLTYFRETLALRALNRVDEAPEGACLQQQAGIFWKFRANWSRFCEFIHNPIYRLNEMQMAQFLQHDLNVDPVALNEQVENTLQCNDSLKDIFSKAYAQYRQGCQALKYIMCGQFALFTYCYLRNQNPQLPLRFVELGETKNIHTLILVGTDTVSTDPQQWPKHAILLDGWANQFYTIDKFKALRETKKGGVAGYGILVKNNEVFSLQHESKHHLLGDIQVKSLEEKYNPQQALTTSIHYNDGKQDKTLYCRK